MAEYIEREAALLEVEEWADTFCECDYVFPHILKSIKKLPAADVRPVTRGEWIKYAPCNSDMMTCSECEKYWILDGDQYDYHFCPNCGAMMEES